MTTIGKGDFRRYEASTKDGHTTLAKLLHAALDNAPLPTDVRRVCGVIIRSSFGNFNYSEKRRHTSCEFSALTLADTLKLPLEELTHALGKLVGWKLVRTSWETTCDPARVYRYTIEKVVNRWTVPGFDADAARQTFLRERQAFKAAQSRNHVKRVTPSTETDPSPIVQAYRELFQSRNPAVMTQPVLQWHCRAARMLGAIGKPSEFQEAAKSWLAGGNIVMSHLGGKRWIMGVGPGELNQKWARKLEVWLLERLQVDRVFRERPEYLLEKRIRGLFDIQPGDPLGAVKVLIGRAIALDWIWLQELHGFASSLVTSAVSAGDPKSLAEAWLGVTPGELLAGRRTRKPAVLRFIRCLSRGAHLELAVAEKQATGKRAEKTPTLGTMKTPGILYPPTAVLTHRKKGDQRVQVAVRLRVTRLTKELEDLAQLCTRHGQLVMSGRISGQTETLLSGENVTACTRSAKDKPVTSLLPVFLDHVIATRPTFHIFHNFHIVQIVSSVTGQISGYSTYKNSLFYGRDVRTQRNSEEIRRTKPVKSRRKRNNNGTWVPTEVDKRNTINCDNVLAGSTLDPSQAGFLVRGVHQLCKIGSNTIRITGEPKWFPEPNAEACKRIVPRIGKAFSFTTAHGTAERNTEGDPEQYEIIIWSGASEDPTPQEMLSGMEYLLGWRGWRPVSGGPFPIRRRRDSLPTEKDTPVETISVGSNEATGSAPASSPIPVADVPGLPVALPAHVAPPPAADLVPKVLAAQPESLRSWAVRLRPPAMISGFPVPPPPPARAADEDTPEDPNDYGLPTPGPVDQEVLACGARTYDTLLQATGLGDFVPGGATYVHRDPSTEECPSPPETRASYRTLDPTQVFGLIDSVAKKLEPLDKKCQKCQRCHTGLSDACIDLVGIFADLGEVYRPEDYRERTLEELRATPMETLIERATIPEFPGPRHEDYGMGYREGDDTFDLFYRAFATFGEPYGEMAETLFDADFLVHWVRLYDRTPFFSTDVKNGKRYKFFSAGLEMHLECVLPLAAKTSVTDVKRLYTSLYLTSERRLRNREGTLDTFARLLTKVITDEFPSIAEPVIMHRGLNDPGLSFSAMEMERHANMQPKTLAELLVLSSGPLISVLVEKCLKYVQEGDSSRIDLSGIPEEHKLDSTVLKFMLEVAHGKWLSLLPDPIRRPLFSGWFSGKMRFEHFTLVMRFLRSLKRAGYVVYDALPEEFKLESLPFLTNESALRVALVRLEGRELKTR